MSGMGKPGNLQTWVYNQESDAWFPASASSGPWITPSSTTTYTTSSVSVDSQGRSVLQIGNDVFFFVSGTIDGPPTASQKAIFGGDVVVSGSVLAFGGI